MARNMLFRLNLFVRHTCLFDLYHFLQQKSLVQKWHKSGHRTLTPHIIKQQILAEFAQRFNLQVLVETGTYRGDMVFALRNAFQKIYSIELSADLCKKARTRFSKFDHIEIWQGDSGSILPSLLKEIDKPCLFWLDSHYSSGITARGELETPIMKEISGILGHPHAPRHVLLIDDARCFKGEGDYPALGLLKDFLAAAGYDHFEIRHDIICCYKSS